MIALAAVTRGDIANYVQALFLVYILLIFVYILLNMMFSLGLRPPYSRFMDAVMNFLMIAIILLYVVETIVVNAIRG